MPDTDTDRYIKLRKDLAKKYGHQVKIYNNAYCTEDGMIRISNFRCLPTTKTIENRKGILRYITNQLHPYHVRQIDVYMPKDEAHAAKLQYEFNNKCVVSNEPYKYKVSIGITKWVPDDVLMQECNQMKQLFNNQQCSEFHKFSKQFMNMSHLDKTTVYLKDDDTYDMLKMTLQMYGNYDILSCKEIHSFDRMQRNCSSKSS